MAHRSLVLGSVLLLGLTLGLTAQIPSGTKYVASSFGGQAGNAIVTLDPTGAITSIIPLAGATRPSAIVMGKRNDEMLVFDSNRLHQIHVITGAQNYTTYHGPSTTGGLLDEDAGLVWCTSQGLLLKANDLSCTQLYTITYMPSHLFQTVGWNGSTGDYVVSAQDQTNQQWQLFTIDANGAILQTLTGMPRITGLDWSPWSGHMYASFDTGKGGVLRIDSTGQVTTLPLPLTPATAGLASVEVREQPYEELVATEGGTDPQHVLVLDLKGGLTSFHTSKGRFAPSDLAILGQRPLWATTPWNVGTPGRALGPVRTGSRQRILPGCAVVRPRPRHSRAGPRHHPPHGGCTLPDLVPDRIAGPSVSLPASWTRTGKRRSIRKSSSLISRC